MSTDSLCVAQHFRLADVGFNLKLIACFGSARPTRPKFYSLLRPASTIHKYSIKQNIKMGELERWWWSAPVHGMLEVGRVALRCRWRDCISSTLLSTKTDSSLSTTSICWDPPASPSFFIWTGMVSYFVRSLTIFCLAWYWILKIPLRFWSSVAPSVGE